MAEIKCINCIQANERIEKRRGLGEDNVEYVDTIECDLGFEISLGGVPGPECSGKYFKRK